ncbi:putative sugar-phosphate nucleotide transferase [Brevibacillus brevis NBRC 100599]|uniref:Putative sugar-phosphate nucleotide transferase n=1 Tax=Brevibacillus brevis (strain 47 / JCM 6285 / NBRC 100599) TaxID=358681 RepID=C0Z6V2_BREBN|nr:MULTISPECIES: nucleotidyltransferase family protein [Bacillales]TQR32559.1 CBS domain-containing protein [Lysinibacillus sp. SDF0063]BAH46301.1 putative sugar-phosphate nucleotide transferase [Brevibacillus brevis NBRC 100599]
MLNWEKILVSPSTEILRALEIIDSGAKQIGIVVDDNRRLLGTITDGDIRRGLLKGKTLNDPIESVMNPFPIVASIYDSKDNILQLMKFKALRAIPVLDEDGSVIQVETLEELMQPEKRDNIVVLMAGGLGSRLRPLTDDCPKPLLKVGERPVLETILMNFIEYGFYRFYISVNYKAEMIRDYFGDGSRWGVQISYIEENKRLGTAGALSLLPLRPTKPFFVINGDLLTKINFEQLLDFHNSYQSIGTMCVREFSQQVPYGVALLDRQKLIGIEEKPIQKYFVNAGIYLLDPTTLNYIPNNEFYDMPTLFDGLIKRNLYTTAFPIREYWLDIGRLSDFERANMEFAEVFG